MEKNVAHQRLLTFIMVGSAVCLLVYLLFAYWLWGSAQAQSPQALIKTDGDMIVFMVDGQERARFDAMGLHVNGDVNYSGAITDTVTYQPAAAAQKVGAE